MRAASVLIRLQPTPSPASWMVVWCSTAIGSSQVNDRAAHRPAHAVQGLDLGGHQLGQLVDVPRLGPGDDVAGPGQARRLRDARQVPERRGYDGRLAGFGLDQNVRGDHGHPFSLLKDIEPLWW